ncbi:hypothetical protein BsWGS_01575 [Bradybaena similaris]
MSTCSEPHLACHHSGPEFDWWRCREGGYVGRPPSPFPASFETARHYRRPESSDLRYETGATTDRNVSTNNGVISNGAGPDHNPAHSETGCQDVGDGTDAHRLFWPLCQGPDDIGPFLADDVGQVDDADGNQKRKKTPRLPYKRPPWIPTKMPNKWGVAGHPPPYTNYCRETLFNTRTADPTKVTIKTTF